MKLLEQQTKSTKHVSHEIRGSSNATQIQSGKQYHTLE